MSSKTINLEFFTLLEKNDRFCSGLGRAVMAAGRLESALNQYLSDSKKKVSLLGPLIEEARKAGLPPNLVIALSDVRHQRNYLVHNLHALFSGLIGETRLPRENLCDADVDIFADRAIQLTADLNSLAALIPRLPSKNT